MKKYLIIVLIMVAGCAKQPVYKASRAPSLTLTDINIGTTANDHTGDPLRTAFGKINTNNIALRNLAASLYTQTETNNLLALKANLASPTFTGVPKIGTDTIAKKSEISTVATAAANAVFNAAIANGYELSDYTYAKGDTLYGIAGNIVTQTQLLSYSGGGGSTSWQELEMIIGTTTGAPASGDTIFTQSGFSGKHIELYRDGMRQPQNSTATNTREGFRFNNLTGALTVLPGFASGEVITITIDEPISQTNLSVEGHESALADSLLAFWNLDETSGIIANDAVGTLNGTATGVTVNQTGQFGKSFLFSGAGYVTMGTSATLRPQTHSISFWVKTTQTSTAGLVSNWVWASEYYGYAVTMLAGGTVEYNIRFTDDTYVTATSTGTINNGSWHNIIATWNGTTARLFIDGVAAGTDTEGSAKTIQYASGCAFRLGDRNEGDLPLTGTIDAVGIWTQVLNGADRTELQTKTHPF